MSVATNVHGVHMLDGESCCCRGHNGKVKSLAWLPDDTELVTIMHDGPETKTSTCTLAGQA